MILKNKYTVIIIIVAIVIGSAAFFGGMKYQESKDRSENGPSRFQGVEGRGGGQNGGGRFGGGTRPVNGEILNVDAATITVKLADGGSKIVLFNDKTSINKASEGTKDELKTGVKVAVFGTENTDGSITAANIQINPVFGGGRTGKAPNQAQKSSDAREIIVDGSNYKFAPDTITVKKGEKVRIVLKNTEGVHDFRVDELGIETAVIREGHEDFTEFTPDKIGSFEFYCSVGNHRALGMKGSLVVE